MLLLIITVILLLLYSITVILLLLYYCCYILLLLYYYCFIITVIYYYFYISLLDLFKEKRRIKSRKKISITLHMKFHANNATKCIGQILALLRARTKNTDGYNYWSFDKLDLTINIFLEAWRSIKKSSLIDERTH